MAEAFIFDINTIVQGNNGNVLPITIRNAASLDGATVRVAIKRGDSVFTKQADLADITSGRYELTLTSSDLPAPGLYFYQPTITYADGREFTGEVGRFNVGGKLSGPPPEIIPPGIELARLGISVSGRLTIDGIEQVGGDGASITPSTVNGSLKVNGQDVTVYDDSALSQSLSALETDVEQLKLNGGGSGSVPSNVILFEDWLGGETVTIDTGTTPPADTTAPILTISPAGGNFASTQGVTMTTNETADIYYTLDGSTPTTASTKYTAPLSLSATTTLKAFARDTAGNSSTVQTVTFTKDVTAPADTTAPIVTASPAAGTYTSAQTVTLSANETATIYYTTNGTTPTTASSVYSAPISIGATMTIQYMARDTAGNQSAPVAATYTINIPQADTTAPLLTITPAATFTDTQTVNMSVNETATIWYTADGSDPITSGTRVQYTAPVTLTATTTVKAYAVDTAGNASGVQTVVYTKDVITPTDGTIYDSFNRENSITSIGVSDTSHTLVQPIENVYGISNKQAYLVSKSGSSPHYRKGLTISPPSNEFALQINIPVIDGNNVEALFVRYLDTSNLVAVMKLTGKWILGKVVAGTYTQISDSGVLATNNDKLKVTNKADGTIDVYINDVLKMTATDSVLQSASFKVGFGTDSTASRFDNFKVSPLTADHTSPIVTISPLGGTFTTSQEVVLTSDKTANIYYTLDGGTPSDQSNLYSNPINLTADTHLRIFAKDSNFNITPIQGASFTKSNPGIIASDTFNRVDSPTLGTAETSQAWTIGTSSSGTWSIVANQASGSGSNTSALLDVGTGNVKISVTIGALVDSGVVFRYKDENNYFRFVRVGTASAYLQKKEHGIMTTIKNIGSAVAVGDVLSVVANGTAIEVFKNGTSLFSTTDSSHLNTTKHGIHELSSGAKLDDFKIEHL